MGVFRAYGLLIIIVHTYSQNKLLYKICGSWVESARGKRAYKFVSSHRPNKASPNPQAVIAFLKKVNGFPNGSCDFPMPLDCSLASSSFLCFASFLHLTGSSGRFEAWLPSGLLVLVLESWRWPWDLFLACDCGKCLVLKGLVGCQ